MRRFKIGDKVRAFLDANFAGEIVGIREVPTTKWMAEGTSSVEFLVSVKLNDGTVKNIKMSELMHDDY